MFVYVLEKIQSSECRTPKGITTFLNPFSYSVLRNNKCLEEFDAIYVDGISMVLILGLFGISVTRRSFDMTSTAREVFLSCRSASKSIAVIGSTDANARIFSEIIGTEFHGAHIVYSRGGYFTGDQEQLGSIDEIVKINPDIVICGMGAGKQEQFLVDLKERGWSGSGFTCGGFIHQTAAKGIRYYPKYVDKLHLRWLYRIFDEPKLIKRYAVSYPIAMIVLIGDLVRLASKRPFTNK